MVLTTKMGCTRSRQRRLNFEPLEGRRLLSASGWQNPSDPLDVDADGFVGQFDAQIGYNALNSTGPQTLPVPATPPPYFDVNGDGDHTPLDLLRDVNFLNAFGGGGGGSGAPAAAYSETINVRLEATDLSGTPITSIPVGTPFLLRSFVEDANALPGGVFAGFIDVTYDGSRAAVIALSPGATYENVQSGSAAPGLLDEVGGVAGITKLGGGEQLLFEAQFVATGTGQITFASDSAEGLGHEVLVYGSDDPVPGAQVAYGSVTLDISVGGPTAINDIFNLDVHTTANVLQVLQNDLSSPGGTGTLLIVSVTPPSQGGAVVVSPGATTLLYTPASSFYGEETFVYTACDSSNGLCSSATVTVEVIPSAPDSFVDANNNGTFDAGIDVPLTHGELADGTFRTTKKEGGYTQVIPGAGLVINRPVSVARDIDFRADGNVIVNAPLNAGRDLSMSGQSLQIYAELSAGRDSTLKADTDISLAYATLQSVRDVRLDAGRDIYAYGAVLAAGKKIDVSARERVFADFANATAGNKITFDASSIIGSPILHAPKIKLKQK